MTLKNDWYDPKWSQGKKTISGALVALISGLSASFGLDLPVEVLNAGATLGTFLIIVGLAGKLERKK